MFGGINNVLYVKEPLLHVDPNGLMEINTSNGLYGSYNYKIYIPGGGVVGGTLYNIGKTPGAPGVLKLPNKFAQLIQPKPINFQKSKLKLSPYQCAKLDEQFYNLYKSMFGEGKDVLTRDEAKKYLNRLYLRHEKEMKEYYGYSNADQILNELDSRAKEHWSNSFHELQNSEVRQKNSEKKRMEAGLDGVL